MNKQPPRSKVVLKTMAGYNNFQTKNFKHTRNESRTNIYEPQFAEKVRVSEEKMSSFQRNIHKWTEFVSWARWHPDLFYDMITPPVGGIRLDLDQRVFLRALARFISVYGVFPRGWGKCVAGDTLLYTTDGMKEIGEYFNYLECNSEIQIQQDINLLNKNGVIETSKIGVYSGYHATKKVTTEEGYSLEGTYNHPILVMSEDGNIVYKQLQDIKIGDYVAINRKNGLWGNKHDALKGINKDLSVWLDSLSKYKQAYLKVKNYPEHIDEDIALFLGYLVGDGCLTRKNVVLFSNIDADIISNYIRIANNKFNVEVNIAKNKKDYVTYSIHFRKYLELLGLGYERAGGKKIPDCILSSPKNVVAAFLRGLFDTDGTVTKSCVEFTSASSKLVEQVHMCLLNFGIVSKREANYNEKYKKYYYTIHIYSNNIDLYYKNIGFTCGYKQKRLEKLCTKKRNPNKDVIPYMRNRVIKILEKARPVKLNNGRYLSDRLHHITAGNNQLTYSRLELLLKHVRGEDKYLSRFLENKYYFSKIAFITDSHNHVYDLSLQDTHSYISNGFVSHNTFLEIMGLFHTAIFFPHAFVSLTAQTKENASTLLEEKYREIIRFYPEIANEITEARFSKDDAEIVFTSGGRIDILANQQSSKGRRRHRLNVEESALLNDSLFSDILEPIVNIPRRTAAGSVDPEELNGFLGFFTTSGFRNTSEFSRNLTMINQMIELQGRLVLGASWELAAAYGRGETRSQILTKKDNLPPVFFSQNYESRWPGATDGALVNIGDVLKLRTLSRPDLKADGKSEYIIAIDVARSTSKSNNQSSIAILKLKSSKSGRITNVSLCNLINLPNGLTFNAQAAICKQVRAVYKAKVAVIDGNAIGMGLVDELLRETFDPITGESLGCWASINTDHEAEMDDAEQILYVITSQGIQHDIIISFIDFVESGKLRLLEKKPNANYDPNDMDYFNSEVLPYLQTDFLIEEISNLKLKQNTNRKFSLEQVTTRVDKDRFMALAYGLYYIKQYEDVYAPEKADVNISDFFFISNPFPIHKLR